MQNTAQKIDAVKSALGPEKLCIVGHHYQNDEIIRHVDITGDSLELSRKVADVSSENIVFCGVHFMAESAALLARPGQKVYLPAPDANCVMAQMAPADLLDKALEKLNSGGRKVLPLAYVNTSLAVKAVVGRHGGAVCTSANASRMMDWAFERAGQVLFLPDKNLGRNTAGQLNIPEKAWQIIDIRKDAATLNPVHEDKKLLLWPGLCAIHARFKVEDIQTLRREHLGIKVAVHPECPPDIVRASDAAGSTSFLISYAENAPDGSTLAIGTEINLVRRLAQKHAGRLTILPLRVSACSDMEKTTPTALLNCLEGIKSGSGTLSPIRVDPAMAENARASLTRMLEACA